MTVTLDATRKKLHRLLDDVQRHVEAAAGPVEFFAELVKAALNGVTGSGAAVWLSTASGHLTLQAQIDCEQVGVDRDTEARRHREGLLQYALEQGRPFYVPPRGPGEPPSTAGPTNPCNCIGLFLPLTAEGQVAGVAEVWLPPDRSPGAIPGYLQFLGGLVQTASRYLERQRARAAHARQQLWTDLEAFARRAHASLDPTEVAYLVANEGRSLVGCDRLSVALRRGRRAVVEAVSGAEVIDRHANLNRRMRVLCARVLAWGEPLVYSGAPDPALPPPVRKALDAYLAESGSKFLALLPLRDGREPRGGRVRSALLAESFEPAGAPEEFAGRAEAVGRHAAGALYNAWLYRRIPFGWLWRPLARLQEGVGGKVVVLTLMLLAALAGAGWALTQVPYPLKMDARGQLLPQERRWVYSPVEGQVVRFEDDVLPGRPVAAEQPLVLMYDVQLEVRLVQLTNEIASAQQAVEALASQEAAAATESDRLRLSADKRQKEFLRDRKVLERKALRERTHSDEARAGYFWLKAPLAGTVLSSEFREKLTNRVVHPSEPVLWIGDQGRPWEVELRIPQRAIGQVVYAFPDDPAAELDVDLLLVSCPTRTFRGKLARDRITGQAAPRADDRANPEPAVLASVRLSGADIPETERVPPELLVTGTEVHARVRCGDHPLGYSLFHGLWEFAVERLAFWQ